MIALRAAALLLPFCWVSCMSNHDTVVVSVNPEGWRQPAVLAYENTDTLIQKEAALVLRYGPEAAPRSGAYIIEVQSPACARTRDTVAVALTPDPSGNKLQEVRLPYRTRIRLTEDGDYIFTVTPPQETSDIWSVAIDFKKLQ